MTKQSKEGADALKNMVEVTENLAQISLGLKGARSSVKQLSLTMAPFGANE